MGVICGYLFFPVVVAEAHEQAPGYSDLSAKREILYGFLEASLWPEGTLLIGTPKCRIFNHC